MEHAVFPEIPVFDPETALADDAERNWGDHCSCSRRGILVYSTMGNVAFGNAACGASAGSCAFASAAARAFS